MAPVAFSDEVVVEELTLPVVHYPGLYGSVFAFALCPEDIPAICDCSLGAIENYLELRALGGVPANTIPDRRALLSSLWFPKSLALQSLEDDSLTWLRSESRVCHRCAAKKPTLRYCDPMYGGSFRQAWGWYIGLEFLQLGIGTPYCLPEGDLRPGSSTWRRFLPHRCPSDIVPLIEEEAECWLAYRASQPNEATMGSEDLLGVARKSTRQLETVVENSARRQLGYRRVGDAWTSETTLALLVEQIFRGSRVLRHHRPQWLEGLELDIYVEELALGIEYQGVQHFQPVGAWGGQEALEALQDRDARKRALCKSLGVTLMLFDYTEPLSEEHLRARLTEVGIRSE